MIMEKKQLLEEEMTFIGIFHGLAREAVLKYYLDNPNLRGFDIAKAISFIDRVSANELKFLEQYPEDYLELYGNS